MRAVVWHGKEDVRVDNVPDPVIKSPTDAIVRVTSTAICGSDLHLYGGKVTAMKPGDIVGHEPMGIVEEVGSEVREVKPGDRVVIPFNISCGHCYLCEDGLYSQCKTTQNERWGKGASLFGYTHLYGGIPGGQAEFMRVPLIDTVHVTVPESGHDHRYLFLSDVLPTAWQGVMYADPPAVHNGTHAGFDAAHRIPRGDGTHQEALAIFGLGPIGQMCVRMAKYLGVERVFGIDRVPERLAMAERHGAEVIDFSKIDDAGLAIRELTAGRGADVIEAVGMEASGSKVDSVLQATKLQLDRAHALRNAIGAVRRGGTLSILGVYVGPIHAFPLGELFDRQVQVRMGQANVRHWTDDLLALVEDPADPLGLDDFVTHRVPLEQAPDAYEAFKNKDDGAIKIVLDPAA